jgi:hypothetical protein
MLTRIHKFKNIPPELGRILQHNSASSPLKLVELKNYKTYSMNKFHLNSMRIFDMTLTACKVLCRNHINFHFICGIVPEIKLFHISMNLHCTIEHTSFFLTKMSVTDKASVFAEGHYLHPGLPTFLSFNSDPTPTPQV